METTLETTLTRLALALFLGAVMVFSAPAARAGGQAGPEAGAASDSVSPRSSSGSGAKVGTHVLPPEAPDPRAYRDTTLTYEEQSKLDEKLRRERRTSLIDSLHLNEHVVLALHAVPAAERRTAAEIQAAVQDCDQLVTAIPPGDWDIFVIAGNFDLLHGVAFSFNWPEDWIVRGFAQNPELEVPFALGDLNVGAARPYMIVFNCIANPARESAVPQGLPYRTGDLVVIGRLEVTATSPGSLTIEDHPNPAYGSPEVANCWNTTQDVPAAARGRIDVGSGPGARPCSAGNRLSPPPVH